MVEEGEVMNSNLAAPSLDLGCISQEWEVVSWADISKGESYKSLCHDGLKLYCCCLYGGL